MTFINTKQSKAVLLPA